MPPTKPIQYKKYAKWLRYVLLIFVAALITTTFLIARINDTSIKTASSNIVPNRIINSKIHGCIANETECWNITAITAQKKNKQLRLETVIAQFENNQSRISAPSAVLFEITQKLQFYDPVLIVTRDKSSITAGNTIFNLNNGNISSPEHIRVDSWLGELTAGSFMLNHATQKITFNNKIRVKLHKNE